MSIEHSPGRAMLRPRAVTAITGLSRTTIWRRVKAGTFPAPLDLGNGLIGWTPPMIDSWLNSRPHVSYGGNSDAA